MTPWQGRAVLDTRGNEENDLPEHYVVTVNLDNHARVEIADTGGGSGVDELIVFGTNESDNIALNAAGSGAFRIGFVQARDSSSTFISYKDIERVEVYTLGGADHVLSNDTAVAHDRRHGRRRRRDRDRHGAARSRTRATARSSTRTACRSRTRRT